MASDPAKKLAAEQPSERQSEDIEGAADRWRNESVEPAVARHPLRSERFSTLSDMEVPDLLTPADVRGNYQRDLGFPGEFPYTRGVQPTMYRGRLWTMRMFAGFGTPRQTNERFSLPVAAGADRALHRVRFPDAHGIRQRLATFAW